MPLRSAGQCAEGPRYPRCEGLPLAGSSAFDVSKARSAAAADRAGRDSRSCSGAGKVAADRGSDGYPMKKLSDLKVKLFTDGADKAQIFDMARQPWINGFTTNPSLLKKA